MGTNAKRSRRARQVQTAGAAAVMTVLGSASSADAMLPAEGGGSPTPPASPRPDAGPKAGKPAQSPKPRAPQPPPKPARQPASVPDTPPRPVRQGHPTQGQVRPQPAPQRKPSATEQLAQSLTDPRPSPPPARNLEELLLPGTRSEAPPRSQPKPRPQPKPSSQPDPSPQRKAAPAPPTGHPTQRRRQPEPVAPPAAAPRSPSSDLEKLLLQPLTTPSEPAKPRSGSPPTGHPTQRRQPAAPADPPRIGRAPEPVSPSSDLEKLLLDPLTNPPKRVTPQPPPPEVKHLKPYERDVALTGVLSPFVSEGETLGASRRLQRPIQNLQTDIDALEDRVEDLDADANPFMLTLAPPSSPEGRQAQRDYDHLAARRRELETRRTQLELYVSGNCDYRCDVDAPYEKNGGPDDPYDQAADSLGAGATRAQVVREAARLEAEQQRETAAKAEQDKQDNQNAGGHLALDAGGFAGPFGPIFDVGNAFWYAAEGNGSEAAWSMVGAVPVAGDLIKGVKMGRKGAKALDAAHDLENGIDAGRALERGSDPARLADDFIADPRMAGRLDDSAESRKALEDIFRRTSSGTRANARIPGRFLPTHTRGHSSELRTLTDLARRPGVTKITPVPASTAGRTPDFVVTGRGGLKTRVEVTTVTGSGRGYQARGIGRAAAPDANKITRAIESKVVSRAGRPTQFDADLPGVQKGGILALHLPGGSGAAGAADAAIARTAAKLGKADVKSVEVYLPGNVVRRYVRKRGGGYTLARPQRPGT